MKCLKKKQDIENQCPRYTKNSAESWPFMLPSGSHTATWQERSIKSLVWNWNLKHGGLIFAFHLTKIFLQIMIECWLSAFICHYWERKFIYVPILGKQLGKAKRGLFKFHCLWHSNSLLLIFLRKSLTMYKDLYIQCIQTTLLG